VGRRREFDETQALDAALAVFWDKGYEGTSLEDLTRATGVARPGLYAAFGNKESFFLKAVDRYETLYMGFMREALEEQDAQVVVRRILEGSVFLQTHNPAHLGCLGINGAVACSSNGEAIRQELIRRRSASEMVLKTRLEEAQTKGQLPAATDCAMLASYVMLVSQGMAVKAKSGTPRSELEAIIEHVMESWPAG